jgi:hypothetical protein
MRPRPVNADTADAIAMISASVATVTCIFAASFLTRVGPLHGHTAWSFLVWVCATVCTGSGWLYFAVRKHFFGILHALPLLCISAYCLAVALPFTLDPPGMKDNPAGGAIAAGNLLVAAVGVVVGPCGLGVLWLVACSWAAAPDGSSGHSHEHDRADL